jgi:hypothetical protein
VDARAARLAADVREHREELGRLGAAELDALRRLNANDQRSQDEERDRADGDQQLADRGGTLDRQVDDDGAKRHQDGERQGQVPVAERPEQHEPPCVAAGVLARERLDPPYEGVPLLLGHGCHYFLRGAPASKRPSQVERF